MEARILIADDNEVCRGALGELIQCHDHWEVCGYAEDGLQAVAKAIELKPDIVILDLAMPRMDGLSAAREIGKALPLIPLVLYSLHGFDLLELEAKKVGIRRVVLKPDNDGLFRAIEELLKDAPYDTVQEKQISATPSVGSLSITAPLTQSEATAVQTSDNDPATKAN